VENAERFKKMPSTTDPTSNDIEVTNRFSSNYDFEFVDGLGAVVVWDYSSDSFLTSVDVDLESVAAPQEIGAVTEGVSRPSIAALEDGGYVVAYNQFDYSNSELLLARFDSDGYAVGSDQKLHVYGYQQAFGPEIAAMSNGGYSIAYTDFRDGTFDVFTRAYAADGSGGTEIRVHTNSDERQDRVAIASLTDGSYAVAWIDEVSAASQRHAKFRIFDQDGAPQTGEIRLDQGLATNNFNPSLTLLYDGSIAAVWQGWSTGSAKIYGRIFAADGTPRTNEFQISDSSGNDADVAPLDTGGFVVVWDNSTSSNVIAAVYDSEGEVAIAPHLLFSSDAEYQFDAEVQPLGGSKFAVLMADVTEEEATETFESPIILMTFDANLPTLLDDIFTADDADNVIKALAGDDTVLAQFGDDTVFGGSGSDTIMGMGGEDKIYGDADDDILYGNDDTDHLFGGTGDDMLFGDDLPVYFFADTAASVYRLYQATLGREPDANGHQNWTTRVATDELTLLQAANGFVKSTEFQNIYGALENADFVNLLYQNVLDRDADDTGLARWVGDLEDGLSRAQVVLGFSNSGEFKNDTATDAAQFGQSNTQQIWTDDVFRLYQATLDRTPDEAGMFNRTARLGDGSEYLDEAAGFVNSTEFKNRFGDDLSNAEFVELMYQNVLGRAADEGGLARWVSDLEDGASRTEVVQGFAQSSEFRNNTAEALQDWMRDNAAGDEIIGGEGDDVMAGGFGSDLFVFRQADVGSDTVLDLEAWDGIDITDFDFADVATAQAAFTQDGTDVVFASGDVEVVFENSDLADFDDGMLFV
jgi:Ca2+-binding RTX toxin-like protein